MNYLGESAVQINLEMSGIESGNVPNKIVIFFVGGVTYEETRAVYMANKDLPNCNVVIGGTSLLNFDSFLDEAKTACSH